MSNKTNISVYILCGGLSSRMQEEKGLVLYKNKPFVAHIIDAVIPISESIVLVTKNDAYKQFGYPLVADIYENKGPVGGIYSALNHSENEFNLILSCDIPNIKTAVLNTYLLQNFQSHSISYLKDDESDYPLIGMYSKKLTSLFKAAILENKLKLLDLIKTTDYNTIQIKPEAKSAVKNINTKEELTALSQLK
ncbi:molybdenum cofactor guanylyltransferase [Winogradskyella endarachnes]|uniref:Probable molybdenum cofactor guanylyltransferase n=1 Tax=Winogradskyella endarachnes TaxID=2681965 RepID=A0A6L6U9Y2_9FLAO|nr:molybdenum cofactor guanylyltransferase [Winogradskyella endarachnes]MUU79140.1 NTP transferase domain-containing protein [Winogradskyella endarachnes]